MRQNQISRIDFPSNIAETLTELDLYDNLISHIKGLEDFQNLTSLDLSFNKIKHIKNVSHLKKLTELFFVQNKITRIEGLDELTLIKNLELGANKIRVRDRISSPLTRAISNGVESRKLRTWKNSPHLRSYGSERIRSWR